ncbi:MAG TPA: alpha/beta hydrolase [Pyrinomonadaceae bacterium]|nr:alpha/beta hydrolase [Pyrinomonadaceae bacterium]
MSALPITQNFAQLENIRLHYAECGSGNDLVILLHGFPEFWYSWRHQLPVIGEKFHAVAPDLRGYNLSDKPPRTEDYQIEALIEDVLGLIRYFEQREAVIIAHDWGAGLAWALAQRHPEVVKKLVALQVPPAKAWQVNFTLRQFLSSWYMFFFQLPGIPEWWAKANDFERFKKMYRETSFRPGAFSDEDLDRYIEALNQPNALTSALNYYRANVFRSLFDKKKRAAGDSRVRVPTLFIYGERDLAVLPSTVRGVNRFVDAPYRELRIPDSGHWVQNEAAEEVNAAIMDFLNDDATGKTE